MGLRPHGDNDCIREVARVEEEDGDVASDNHLGGRYRSGCGDAIEIYAEASDDLLQNTRYYAKNKVIHASKGVLY